MNPSCMTGIGVAGFGVAGFSVSGFGVAGLSIVRPTGGGIVCCLSRQGADRSMDVWATFAQGRGLGHYP